MADDNDLKPCKNPLAAFAAWPEGVFFESQEKGEKIILLLRAHVVTLVPALFIIIFLLLVPFLIQPVLSFLNINAAQTIGPSQLFLIMVFWYLLTFGYAFYRFIFWYFNVYILTNERVVDIDFRGILDKEIAYAKLNQIQDVSPKTIGFFGTFFNYGDIFVQTAAERPEFEFHHVPKPDEVARAIIEQVRLEEGEPPGVIA